jgi:hypothetical protein
MLVIAFKPPFSRGEASSVDEPPPSFDLHIFAGSFSSGRARRRRRPSIRADSRRAQAPHPVLLLKSAGSIFIRT